MYQKYLKRIFDVVFSLAGLILLMPVFIIITIVLFLTNQGRPLFIQWRPGKNEKIFRLLKFKTMSDKRDADGNLLPDIQRITRVGKILRNSSLDEIPQLVNVLKGDMSIVGPRPLLTDYLPRYNAFQRKRHLVKPGITGWAQVNGRNSITWQQKFDYDVWYVENINVLTDLKIIWLSITRVFSAKNINSTEANTMSGFSGN